MAWTVGEFGGRSLNLLSYKHFKTLIPKHVECSWDGNQISGPAKLLASNFWVGDSDPGALFDPTHPEGSRGTQESRDGENQKSELGYCFQREPPKKILCYSTF